MLPQMGIEGPRTLRDQGMEAALRERPGPRELRRDAARWQVLALLLLASSITDKTFQNVLCLACSHHLIAVRGGPGP